MERRKICAQTWDHSILLNVYQIKETMPHPNPQTHVHTWVKWKKNFGEMQYRCKDPDCFDIKPKSLLVGKKSLCTICRQEMTLTLEDLRRANPRCINCSDTKAAKKHKEIEKAVDSVFDEIFGATEEAILPLQKDGTGQ